VVLARARRACLFVCRMTIAMLLPAQVVTQSGTPKITCHQAQVSPNPLRNGQPGILSYTISNDGAAPYTGLLKCVWVNLAKGRVDDLPQSTFNGILQPGQYRTLSHTSIPIVSPPGSYQMRVVDGNGKMFDHCASQTFTVIASTTLPDLKVQALQIPATVYPGEKISIDVKVQNQGSWKSGKCKGRLYWDINPSFGEAARPIDAADTWQEIAANSTALLSIVKTLPIDLPNGPMYFFYCIDYDLELKEADESNNCLAQQRKAGFRLEIAQPIGYVPYPNTPRGVSVTTDLNLVNPSDLTFNGTLAVSIFSPQDAFLMDLATWPNIHIAPSANSVFSTGIKTSPILNFAVANNYKIYARYKSGQSQTFSTIQLGKCGGCLNPFHINIVAPRLTGVPAQIIKLPSTGSRGQMRMGL
jgi:hypothetical protein